jgi:hypothetical protein
MEGGREFLLQALSSQTNPIFLLFSNPRNQVDQEEG